MFFAVSTSVPLSPVTSSVPGPFSVPVPMNTVILFFFIRCVTPWFSCLATPRERATTAPMSARTLSAARP